MTTNTNKPTVSRIGSTVYFKDGEHHIALETINRNRAFSSSPSVTGAQKIQAMLNRIAALEKVAEAAQSMSKYHLGFLPADIREDARAIQSALEELNQ